jgi:predicted helicase
VKFIRWAQWRIEETGQGVLAFITNNGYLDNPTFRGMRQQLMQSFDEIYLLDLHGSAKKKELIPGTDEQDKNVFDIQQGVAIGIFVKLPANKRQKDAKCVVRHAEIWGRRKDKYAWLGKHSVKETDWTELKPSSPRYLFIPKDERRTKEYERGWSVADIFPFTRLGPNSHRDDFAIAFSAKEAKDRIRELGNPLIADSELRRRYGLKDTTDWKLTEVRKRNLMNEEPVECLYRPFDFRSMLAGDYAFDRFRPELMRHLTAGTMALISLKQATQDFSVFVTDRPVGQHKLATPYDGSYVSPLYLTTNGESDEEDALIVREDPPRRANLAPKFTAEFAAKLGLRFIGDGAGDLKKTFGPEDVFHYAYAVFHSPGYRARYAEFLRMDFPRLPLTANMPLFRKLAAHGADIAALHLLRKDGPDAPGFPVPGPCTVDDIRYIAPGEELPVKAEGKARDGRVHINPHQYFDGVPPEAWAFPIGGYLPAQKWLKDRKGRALSYEEQAHYPRLIAALAETGRLMTAIDKDIDAAGGWPLK